MSPVQPLEIQCPKCSQIYRFGTNIPRQFACRTCATVMDLSAYAPAPAAPPRVGSSGTPGSGARRQRPAFKPRPPQSAVAKWSMLVLLVLIGGWRLTRALGRSGVRWSDDDERAKEKNDLEEALKRISPRRNSIFAPGITLLETSAWEGDVLTTSPAKIEGIYSMGKPTDEILVNDFVARTGNGPFAADVPLSPGVNSIEISLKAGAEIERHAIHVTYKPATPK